MADSSNILISFPLNKTPPEGINFSVSALTTLFESISITLALNFTLPPVLFTISASLVSLIFSEIKFRSVFIPEFFSLVPSKIIFPEGF